MKPSTSNPKNAERLRLDETRGEKKIPWKKWGPYLSERQWGTVREDYSTNGDAWNYFSHDQARSRAYRWGEDGIAGISDDKQQLCFAVALWNGADPILKERMFGLTNSEGNHGEDVKEYYFYLDNNPTHSYMKYLYKYPQRAYPYGELVERNRRRNRNDLEYELLDTGVFDGDRYFDVFVEYAKAGPEDILILITAHNRGPDAAKLHILPTLWFRNQWTWEGAPKPALKAQQGRGRKHVAQEGPDGYRLVLDGDSPLLFTENETNNKKLFGGENKGYCKDGINDYIVNGDQKAVNPAQTGTKAAYHCLVDVPPGGQAAVRLRLSRTESPDAVTFGDFDTVFAARRRETDEFYASITPPRTSADSAAVMRQALAGMLWGKQYYYFDLDRWLEEHGWRYGRSKEVRNAPWFHMANSDVISMPDKWEYPWYAAWDLAFHTVPLGMVDLDFAKSQLELMMRNSYLHPSGQLPAYEWNFGDVNPPVHAFAALMLNDIEREERGRPDYAFLKSVFDRLLLNFTWWVNRKDVAGRNVFQGGFLGLDNIGVFDRSAPLPTGGYLDQADGTAWMAMFAQNMVALALELAAEDPHYGEMAIKFLGHFLWISAAMTRIGDSEETLWDEEDGFFYDVLRLPNGLSQRLKVRTLVGLLPVCCTTILEERTLQQFPDIVQEARTFLARQQELVGAIAPPGRPGHNNRRLFAMLNEERLRRVLARMLDEREFLSPYGIRALSRVYAEKPYVLDIGGQEYRVEYMPAESNTAMFGGNSNWRGPIWFPINALLLRGIYQFYRYYGDEFKVECPTGSGRMMTLFEVGQELSGRMGNIFLRKDGRRAVYGGTERFQNDPNWRDHLLFYEYFHGDNGAGLGASHQTGWTGLIARIMQLRESLTPEIILRSTGTADALRYSLAG